MSLQGVVHLLESRWFFAVIVLLFVLQAAWIAVSSQYPQAYDESFHVGIIEVYSGQWSPFIPEQSAETYALGEIIRLPSYFYHYAMSFPYRVLDSIFRDFETLIIALRFINIALLACSIVVFRRVLLAIKPSKSLVHLVLFVFASLPIMPYLAAHINYDNLLILLTAIAMLLTIQFAQRLLQNKVDAIKLSLLTCVLCIASITKFSFLPIALAIFICVCAALYLWQKRTKRSAASGLYKSFLTLSVPVRTALIVCLIVSAGLFIERYGYNAVVYKDPDPACHKVLNVEACTAYAPWYRNYQLAQAHQPQVSPYQMARFANQWHFLTTRGLFTIFDATNNGVAQQPLQFLRILCVAIAWAGCVLAVIYWRKIIRLGYPLWICLIVATIYTGILIVQNYTDFTRFGIPIAIQARYLLPVLPIIMLVACLGFSYALKTRKASKSVLAVLALLLFTQGGGVLTYILLTDRTWYREDAMVTSINATADAAVRRVILVK